MLLPRGKYNPDGLTYATAAVPHVHIMRHIWVSSSFCYILIIYFSGVSAVCRPLVSDLVLSWQWFYSSLPIPDFHYEEKKSPACKGHTRGIFQLPVPTAGAACGTHKHGIRRKTPIIYVAFSVLVHKHTYCSRLLPTTVFSQRVVRSSAFCIAFHKSSVKSFDI